MQENILHFIWQCQYFSFTEAKTTEGELVQVLHQGIHNTNAGPDFSQAKVKVGDVEWNGDVEIHVNSMDWATHQHHTDEAYNKVVLHVVWQANGDVFRKDGTPLPTLELKNLVDDDLMNRALGLIESIDLIPCSTQIDKVSEFTVLETIHRALVKRLERKAQVVMKELSASQGDWSEVAYRLLMRQMGMKINGDPFYNLAELVPYKLLRKYKHSTEPLEAILFGASGLLNSSKGDEYVEKLRKEYDYIAHKHTLTKKLNTQQWKFLRLRPSNFPTLRIAQVASIIRCPDNIFESLVEFKNINELMNRLKVKTSLYWNSHYRFGAEANQPVPSIGKMSIELILLNVVAPLLAAYSLHISDNSYMDKAVALMEALKPEKNRIIKRWSEINIKPENGAESQGLIELFNEHCQQKACLTCGIGYKLLNYNS